MIDLEPFLDQVRTVLDERESPGGGLTQRPDTDEVGPYGCADAMHLAYTLGDDLTDDRWARCADRLAAMQGSTTGWWVGPDHHRIHTTAHCLGALELVDRRPDHRLRELRSLDEPGALERFLDGLDWQAAPWTESHRGAGIWAARTLAGEASDDWSDRYFGWFDAECDPETGLWRRGALAPAPGWNTLFPHLAGTFHYLFNYRHADRPHPHPAALAATACAQADGEAFPWGHFAGFAEIDVIYCITRATRDAGDGQARARKTLERLADRVVPAVVERSLDATAGAGDLHLLFGSVCAVAALQAALGQDRLASDQPLRLVLDRRPFI